jgi:hypothetical protein
MSEEVVEGTGQGKLFPDVLGPLLGKLGILSSKEYDAIKDVVESELHNHKLVATFVGLRYGEIVLESDPQTAALLRYETGRIVEVLDVAYPGLVSSIRVRTIR